MLMLLPLVSLVVSTQPVIETLETETTSSSRVAQVRLAEAIGDADAVHSIAVRRTKHRAAGGPCSVAKRCGVSIDISLDRDGIAYRVVASIGPRGAVTQLTIAPRTAAVDELGSLSWLSVEMQNATAISRVTVDEDDAVTLTTDTGEAFMIIPGRGSGGNESAAARWAAAWDSPEA